VTLEAFRSGKAVLTATDSGGPAELVRHGENGLVTEATPEAVAAQLDALGRDRGLAERLGQNARRDAEAHRWERAVEELLRDV
jgi:glycosyltransferase involved in cell wall biosynthesis